MKLVSIQANTDFFKNKTIESLKRLIEDVEKGKIEILLSQYVAVDGDIATLVYTSAAKESILKQIGLLEYMKDLLLGKLGDE